jgi:hydroxymethylpyrimidine pyrophosphatase-like HAD family hydrolase
MEFDVIICDVDGCLADENGGPFDLPRLMKLADYNLRAQSEGIGPPLTVCTGRPEPFAEAMCRLLSNTTLPCIAENGTWLFYPANNRYELDPAITPEHLEFVHAASKLLDEKYRPKGVQQQPGKKAAVTLYHSEPDFLQRIMPDVRDVLQEHNWPFRVSMTWNYINCDLEFVSKASGLKRFFSATGIDPIRAAAIGDTMSDLAMAEAVAWFACPANAGDEIKQHADYVSPHAEVEGVIDIVEKLT